MTIPKREDSSGSDVRLRMFDIQAVIRSDSSSLLNFFERMYRRFLVEDFTQSEPVLELALYTQPAPPWDSPVLVLGGDVWPLDEGGVLEAFAYDGILNTILSRVQSHYLIHAGSVARNGQGIMLVGEAGYGKTTLTMELVRRGYNFLSDELAALSRSDFRMYAFPRQLRVRYETLQLLGIDSSAQASPQIFGKNILDIEEIYPGSLVESASIGYVFILRDASRAGEKQPEQTGGEFGVYVDRISQELLTAIQQIKGISELRQTVELGYPVIRMHAFHKIQAIQAIEQICAGQGVHILEISKRAQEPPSFDGPAKLDAIPQTQAVIGLLRQFQPGNKSSLLAHQFGGSATQMFINLASLLERTRCYLLTTGPLGEMADLICAEVK